MTFTLLLVLGLKECLVECATLCVKSEVILTQREYYERGPLNDEVSTLAPHNINFIRVHMIPSSPPSLYSWLVLILSV